MKIGLVTVDFLLTGMLVAMAQPRTYSDSEARTA